MVLCICRFVYIWHVAEAQRCLQVVLHTLHLVICGLTCFDNCIAITLKVALSHDARWTLHQQGDRVHDNAWSLYTNASAASASPVRQLMTDAAHSAGKGAVAEWGLC